MRLSSFLLGLITLLVITLESAKSQEPQEAFTRELLELKEFFSIPGVSALVSNGEEIIYEHYFGHANLESHSGVDSLTAFPVASITKLFSATLAMKLVETGKLSLEDPVRSILPSVALSDSIRVKHLLSHTSQGNIGVRFYYSARFGLLTRILEQVSQMEFGALMTTEILRPLELNHTFLLKDSLQLGQLDGKMASPYVLEGEIEKGFIDYGYSASAGIVSTPGDLLAFSQALDLNTLISEDSREAMYRGLGRDLPYSYGIFRQVIQGLEVLWVYGQYDCYSSLLLKVPEKQLTLILLANNNLMSDPARLIMGDIQSSLFAVSFLKNFVFDGFQMPLIENPEMAYNTDFPEVLYKRKVLAQALAESFMARFDPEKIHTSAQLIERTFKKYPDYLTYGDINLLHTLCFLKDVAFYMDLGAFDKFDLQIEKLGSKLLEETPDNPYIHSYLGTFYDRKGNKEQAEYHYQFIADLDNFSPNWYTREALEWLQANE